jgi:hypothetical protein
MESEILYIFRKPLWKKVYFYLALFAV